MKYKIGDNIITRYNKMDKLSGNEATIIRVWDDENDFNLISGYKVKYKNGEEEFYTEDEILGYATKLLKALN